MVCIAALKKICNHPSLVFGASQEAATNLELDDSIEEESLYDGLLSVFPQDYDDKQGLNPQESGKLGTLSKMLDNISSMDERVVVVSNYTQVMLLDEAQFGNLELLALLQWIYAYVPSNFYFLRIVLVWVTCGDSLYLEKIIARKDRFCSQKSLTLFRSINQLIVIVKQGRIQDYVQGEMYH